MKYYIINDNPSCIRVIRMELANKKVGSFWINEDGMAIKKGIPDDYLNFNEVVTDKFKENIVRYINDDSIFFSGFSS